MVDPIAEIKAKISILDVVSEKIQLKKAGRLWKGLCPWHKEKTPSFTVSPDKEMCYCFGCHRGGDIFTFIQDTENVDFKGALEILAERAGVKLHKEAPEKADMRKKMFLVNQLAADWFHLQLMQSENAEPARNYLARRKISKEAIEHFYLGWAPDSWDALLNYLKGQEIENQLLSQSGLMKLRESSADEYYDLFRARLMFPVRNSAGKIIAFSGRVLDDSLPKYVNSPETFLYKKQNELFHFSDAKKAIVEKDQAVIVEGNVDVVASWEAKAENVVAPLGTALTQTQLEIILRLTKNLVFAFDADLAGQKATRKSVELALQLGGNVKIVKIPGQSDPDDIVRKEGAEKWQLMISQATQWFDFFVEKAKNEIGLARPEDKKKFAENILSLVRLVNSPVEQESYLDELSKILNISREALKREMTQVKSPEAEIRQAQHPGLSKKQKTIEDYFFGLILAFPKIFEKCALELDKINFTDNQHKKFAKLIAECYSANAVCDLSKVSQALEHEDQEYLNQNSFFASEKYSTMNEKKIGEEMKSLYQNLYRKYCKNTRSEILNQLQEAKSRGDDKMEEAARKRLDELLHS
ncbi:MAG: DNA primase [Patescibacteria group bacterium]|nr:DNA primase [Patescibacteria group bacterium]